jgi:serine/threonine protein phosphatase PrpC
MKSYEQLEKEIDELIKIRKTKDLIVNRLLKQVKETNIFDNISYHRSLYE